MALVLTYQARTDAPVDVDAVIPSAVRGKSLAEIERIEVVHGDRKTPLAELFRISGDPSDGRVEWQGGLDRVHGIGARQDGGEILVSASAGHRVGSEMSAGTIRAEEDVGDWLGAGMRGGLIYVRGRAGHFVGAALPGSSRGMTGGTLLVEGPAGNEVGRVMRRGLIAVGGADAAAGLELRGGILLVFGPCGDRPGAAMRRGTIGAFGRLLPTPLPTFRYGCRFWPPLVPLLTRELRRLGYPVPEGAFTRDIDLYHGDLAVQGEGEMLLACGSESSSPG